MSERLADILDDAADLLERKGWIQGRYSNENGHCAVGAITRVCGLYDAVSLTVPDMVEVRSQIEAAYQVERVLRNILAERGGPLHVQTWNDKKGRTKQEVLDLLREGAKRERP